MTSTGARLDERGDQADPQRFAARCFAHEADDRQQLGRLLRRQRQATDLIRAHESAALAAVIVDLQIVEALAANLDHFALPQLRLLFRRVAR
jgi:hypothetical protein